MERTPTDPWRPFRLVATALALLLMLGILVWSGQRGEMDWPLSATVFAGAMLAALVAERRRRLGGQRLAERRRQRRKRSLPAVLVGAAMALGLIVYGVYRDGTPAGERGGSDPMAWLVPTLIVVAGMVFAFVRLVRRGRNEKVR